MTPSLYFSSVLLLSSVFLAACGSGPIAADDDTGNTDDEETTASATETETETETETDTSDDDPEPASACIEAGAIARPLVISNPDTEQLRVYADGPEGADTPVLILDNPAPPGDLQAFAWATANETHVLGLAARSNDDPGILRLFERGTGALVWEHSLYYQFDLGTMSVDAQSRVVAPGLEIGNPLAHSGVAIVDGEVFELSGFEPRGPFIDDVWLPGIFDAAGNVPDSTGFLSLADNTVVTVTLGHVLPPGWRANDGRIEYIDLDVSPPEYVLAEPTGEDRMPLPDLPELDLLAIAGDYRLVAPPLMTGTEPLIRVNVDTQTVESFTPTLPAGSERFVGCSGRTATVDRYGNLLVPLREGSAVWLQAWSPTDDTWTPIGPPHTQIGDVVFRLVHAGPWIGVVTRGDTPLCAVGDDWPNPPADAIAGDEVRVVRVEPPDSQSADLLANLIPYGPAYLSLGADGLCGSWLVNDAFVLQDLEDGERISLAPYELIAWLK